MNPGLEVSLVDLVKTYSPTGHEDIATGKFCDYLNDAGASYVRKDRAGNAMGTLNGSGLKVTLCGHIDTVPGRLPVRLVDGKLFGRGAVDAKSSLVSLLYGALIAKEKGFGGRLNIVAAVGEEGPGKGIMEVASSHEKADYAILGEPSGTTGITVGYRGRLLLEASFRTPAYHASAPWMGPNAVDLAMNSWIGIKETYAGNREFSLVSAALTSFHGGGADNVTPSKASFRMDVRFPPSVKRSELFGSFESMISGQAGDNDLKLKSYVDPYVANLKTPLVQAFKDSIMGLSGQKARMIFKSGSGDMNHLATSWNIPCVTYGPGDTQLSHTRDEVIGLIEVAKSAEIVADALLKLEGLHPDWQ